MNTLCLHDKKFEICIPSPDVQKAVDAIALRMNLELCDKNPIFISILNGSFMFTSDLMKRLIFNCELSFIKLSSYKGLNSSGEINELVGLNENLENRMVVILEDIIDTGTTIAKTVEKLRSFHPSEIRIATLFLKPEIFKGNITLDYVGIEVPNKFIVGCGLDYNGLGRNYPDLYALVP